MKKIIIFVLGSIVAVNLSMSVAFAATNEVRVAFFLEWCTAGHARIVHTSSAFRGSMLGRFAAVSLSPTPATSGRNSANR